MEFSPSLLSRNSMGRPSSICPEDTDNTLSQKMDVAETEPIMQTCYPLPNDDNSTSMEK